MNIQYNALEYAHQLEGAGVPKAQAEVHANMLGQVLSDCVALPGDLRALRGDLTHQIVETETRLRAEIKETEMRLRAEIKETEMRLRGEIKETETRLRGEIVKTEARLGAKIEIVEARVLAEIDKQSRFQKLSNGLIATLIIGLYIQLFFR
jgi:hypothetical protein